LIYRVILHHSLLFLYIPFTSFDDWFFKFKGEDMKVLVYSLLSLFLLNSVSRAQEFGIGASYVFVEDLDDVYGVVGHALFPVSDSFYFALRGAAYQDVERSATVGPVQIDISADYYPVDFGLGWMTALGEGGMTFYTEAGGSYVFVESDIELNGSPFPAEIENDIGWYVTAGLRLGEGPWKGFIEAQLRTFTWSVDEGGLPPGTPTPDDIELDHIALNLGVAYQW
jgi:hypothetical protein